MFKYLKEYVDFSIKLNNYISTFMSDNGISYEDYNYSHIWKLIQSQGVTIRGFKFKAIASGQIAGLLIQDQFETTIGYNQGLDEKSKNFAISHEIIHYLFHMNNKNQLFFDTTKNLEQWYQDEWQESQANIGASMILIPDSVLFYFLKKGWTISRVATVFGLSEQGLTSRLVLTMQASLGYSFTSAKDHAEVFNGKGRTSAVQLATELDDQLKQLSHTIKVI